MAGRVAVISPEGQFGTVDSADAEAVTRAGGRVLTAAQVKERALDEEYDKHSTAGKVIGGALSTVAGPIVGNALSNTGVIADDPRAQSFNSGAASALTLGLDEVAVKHGLDAVQPGAGAAYGKHILDTREAHPGFNTAGKVTGFAAMAVGGGGLSGAAKAAPGAAVSALGGAAEQGVARVLGGVAARGIGGRALATAAELGARGAVEGALYSGADAINEADLGDHDVVADKVFAAMGTGALYGGAGGAVLGGAGSLGAAGARAGGRAAVSGLSRVLSKGSEVATELAGKAEGVAAEATALSTRAAGDVVTEARPSLTRQLLGGEVNEAARSGAQTMAFDALGTTKVIARQIEKDVRGGTKAVGDYVNRRILQGAEDEGLLSGAFNAGRNGRADQLLPRIQAELAVDGAKIGDLVKATPVRVHTDDLLKSAERIATEMSSDPTRIQGAESFRKQVGQTFEAFVNGGKLTADARGATMDLSDMYYARSNMEKVAHEMTRKDTAAGAAMKEWLRDVDATLVTKLDEAAEASGTSGVKQELLAAKREFQLGKAAEKAAQDGANRIAGNNSVGIREGMGAMVGMATGHPLLAIGTAVGGKLARERASAAGAYLLNRVADMGILQRAVSTIDEHIGKASAGVLSTPKKLPLPEGGNLPVHARAAAAMEKWAKVSADPDALATRAAGAGEHFQGTAPLLAGGLSQRLTSAAAFMIGKMPSVPDPDPFDPHPRPMLTDAQASEYALYDYYAEKPTRFFEEAAHGKLTYEGCEVARALMPAAFAEMQQRTIEGLADLMAKKRPPPYLARQRLGMMLDFPAVPEQRPDHMAFLQKNVIGSEKAGQADVNTLGAQSPPKRPMPTKSQSSTLDRLEGK